ncbi:hypothetical protein AN402_1656 [Bacillus wiedmannii]|nr:hypothetical protein AN402_1656 [Bacillus wiedmannii]
MYCFFFVGIEIVNLDFVEILVLHVFNLLHNNFYSIEIKTQNVSFHY